MIHHPSFIFLLALGILVVSGFINYFRPDRKGFAPSIISITAFAMAVGLAIGGVTWKLGHIGRPISPISSGLLLHWLQIPSGGVVDNPVWIDVGIRSDTLGVAFFITVLLICMMGQIHLSASIRKDEPQGAYYAFSAWALAALGCAFLAVSVLQLLALILLAALMGWLMLMQSRDEPVSGPGLLAAGPLLIPIGLAGASLALVTAGSAIGGLHWLAGGAAWPKSGALAAGHHGVGFSNGAVTGILVGLGVLGFGAQIPFQIWPHEYAKSAPSTSYLLMINLILGAAPFLAQRLLPFFDLDARLFIAVAAAATSLMTALSTLKQNDIRQILAGLTSAIAGLSQVFIMTGSSAAGLTLALIALMVMTGLMMIAGTVVHVTDREADIRRMGGLWRQLPLSAIFSLLLIVAISGGVHLGAAGTLQLGFIGLHAYATALGVWGGLLCWAPILALVFTAISLVRWWWRIFVFKPSTSQPTTLRESPLHTFPPLILLVGAWLAGTSFLDLPMLIHRALSHHNPPQTIHPRGLVGLAATDIPWMVFGALLLVGLAYSRGDQITRQISKLPGPNLITRWLNANMYVAELYSFLLGRPVRIISIAIAVLDEWISGWLAVMLALAVGTLGLLVAMVDGFWTLRWWPPHGRRMPPLDPDTPGKNRTESAS